MGDRFSTIDMGRKVGAVVPLSVGGAGSPALWPGPRPTSISSGILIHPTVWPQYTNVTIQTDNGPRWVNRFTNGRPKTVVFRIAAESLVTTYGTL